MYYAPTLDSRRCSSERTCLSRVSEMYVRYALVAFAKLSRSRRYLQVRKGTLSPLLSRSLLSGDRVPFLT